MTALDGQVALVTGGASGLGAAIARRLASDGATVVISDVQADLAAEVAGEIGGDHLVQDVTDEAGWDDAIRQIVSRHGGLNILVNNAGIFDPPSNVDPERMPFDVWRRTLAVNLDAVFLGCRAAIPAIRDSGGGSIVNIASMAGEIATPYATAYGASKAAVRQLTKSVAQHCAQERNGVRCNSVHPGVVLTPQYRRRAEQLAVQRGTTPEQILIEAAERTPLGELVEPEEIAEIVAFLCSDHSRHTTGAMFVVDSGTLGCDSIAMSRQLTKTAAS